MSIGIYSFLRIYFLSFGLSAFAQFRTHSMPSSVQTPVRSSPRVLSGIECRPVQRVQRPGVCLALRGLRLAFGAVCPAACRVQSFRVRWSGQGCTGGVYSRRPAPPGQSRHRRKNKKGSKKITPPLLPISKISRKNKKTPTKGLCSVLYLPYKP